MTLPGNPRPRTRPSRRATGLDQPRLELDGACAVVRARLLASGGSMEYACGIELLGLCCWRVDWVTPEEEGTAVLVPWPDRDAPSDRFEQAVAEAFARATFQSRPLSCEAQGRHWRLLTSRVAWVPVEVSPEPATEAESPSLSPGVAPAPDAVPGGLSKTKDREAPRERIPLALLSPEFHPLAEPPSGRLVLRRLVDIDPGYREPMRDPGHPREERRFPLGHALELAWESPDEEGRRLVLRKRDLDGFPISLLHLGLGAEWQHLEPNETRGREHLVVLERRVPCVEMKY